MIALSDTTKSLIERSRNRHPFLSFLIMVNGDLHAGIIQNTTQKVVLFYDFDRIPDESKRLEFLRLADQWWWGSSQTVPVNYFIGRPFDQFQSCLIGHPKKAIHDIVGPTFSLADCYIKRIKMKRVEILRKPALAA